MGPLEGCFKIGRTRDVDKRRSQIRMLLPVELGTAHAIATDDVVWLESSLHWAFAECRTRGEWFRLSADAIEIIRSFASASCDADLPAAVVAARDSARAVKCVKNKPERNKQPEPLGEDCGLPDLLTVAQAAASRNVAGRTVREWIERGLPSVRIVTGKGMPIHLIRRSDLAAYTPRPRGAAKGNQHARKKK